MARSPNCTGAPIYRGRVDVSITYPDADEAELSPGIELPTEEPATPQIAFTVGSAHLPIWTPYELPHTKSATLFTSSVGPGSARDVYYRVTKNGSSVATGKWGHSTSPFTYTHQFPAFPDIQIGDTLGCSLWSSGAGVVAGYKAVIVQPTRIGAGLGWLADVRLSSSADAGKQLHFGTPTVKAVYDAYACLWGVRPQALSHVSLNATAGLEATWDVYKPHPQYGFGRINLGDYGTGYLGYTHFLDYAANVVFARISYTPLNLRV